MNDEPTPKNRKDPAWRARHGFDNIMGHKELLEQMPREQRYAAMDRLDRAGFYDR